MTQPGLFPEDSLRGPGGIAALRDLKSRAEMCKRCPLWEDRKQVVFGEGLSDRPTIAFIGEGPGMFENEQGRPFVGGGGKLLNKMIKAMGLVREELYLCNVIKCQTPNNTRKPEENELVACKMFWMDQMRIIQPMVIVALGGTAARSVCNSKKQIKDLRGRWLEWKDTSKGKVTYGLVIPVRATYHPSYLLNNPQDKKDAWKDLQIVQNWINQKKEKDTHETNENETKH